MRAAARTKTFGIARRVLAATALMLCAAFGGPCFAASAAPPAATPTPAPTLPATPDKMLINADQLTYDKTANVVSAIGDVQLYYRGRVLQADKVTYNQQDRHVFAEGHVKLTDEKGNIVYATRLELTDDFKAGFIDRAQALSTDNTRLSAARVERSGGNFSTAENGIYTACEPCKDHPERPPLWDLRAKKVTEDQLNHRMYYEDAWLEILGTPIAWVPYFSAPDASVSKATGVLAPIFFQGSRLGFGMGLPIFINLAPDYDLTLTPTYLTKQGFYGEADWRQRFSHGEYDIRLTGVDQQQPSLFLPEPYGAGDERFRGSFETNGLFYLNQFWKVGWDATFLSDRFYLQDYKLKSQDATSTYYQDIVTSIYLRGQGERGFFDLSAYRFQGTTASDEQRSLPLALPVLDYNKGFSLPPDATGGLGGEATVTLNAQYITRAEAAFQAVGTQTLDKAYNLYNVCEPGGVPDYNPGACLLRGIAGDYTRTTAEVDWQRKFTDPLGEQWTPFVFARADGQIVDLNTSGGFVYSSSQGTSTIFNASQMNFFNGANGGSAARAMAGIGLEYRYPFVEKSSWGTQTIQPIGQLIVRPNEGIPGVQPNEDAQSLVFDETNLFAWDKYSGFDRIEGGVRFNYGAQYDMDFANGGHAQAIVGQSIQVAGQNSFATPDAANTGLESGLDQKYSNIVAGETIAPFSGPLTFGSKQQVDNQTFKLARFDALITAKLPRFSTTFDYGYYQAQPLLGWPYPREGFTTTSSLKLTDTWSANGSLYIDMSRHYYDTVGENTSRYFPGELFDGRRLCG